MSKNVEDATLNPDIHNAGRRAARRLVGLYDELDDIDPHGAAVLREEPVESGSLYESWESFVEALRTAADATLEDAPLILEAAAAELSDRPFRLLAPEFEHLVTDLLEHARESLSLRERADVVAQLFSELKDVDEAKADGLLAMTIHHDHPSEIMRGGVTYEQALDALEKASEKSWDNIEAEPDGLAAVILKSDIAAMEVELREALRATGAVVALH